MISVLFNGGDSFRWNIGLVIEHCYIITAELIIETFKRNATATAAQWLFSPQKQCLESVIL